VCVCVCVCECVCVCLCLCVVYGINMSVYSIIFLNIKKENFNLHSTGYNNINMCHISYI